MLNPIASLGVVIFGNVWAARVQADRAAAATSTRGWMGRDFMSESLYRMRPGPLRRDARLLRSPCFFPLTPTVSRCSLKYLAHVCSHQGHVTQAKRRPGTVIVAKEIRSGLRSGGHKGQRLVLNTKRRKKYEPCMFHASLGARTSFNGLHESRVRAIGFGFDFRVCERPQRSHGSEGESQREKRIGPGTLGHHQRLRLLYRDQHSAGHV